MRGTPKRQEKGSADAEGGGSFLGYFVSRQFWLTLLAIGGAALIAFFLLNVGLRWYTNHGQRLEVGEYVGMSIDDARRQVERADFRVEISDSVFLVDQPPRVVLRQDPQPGSFVKENRRIYLTVTKAIPDEVELPALTGTYDFDRYRRKLLMLDVDGKVRERKYSSRYEANTILEVYYEGAEITEAQLKRGFKVPKGAMLEFVVTSKEGGLARLPELTCRTLEEATFFLEEARLRLGRVQTDATVTNPELAYVWRQDPPFREGYRLPFDAEVNLFVTARPPEDCDTGL